MKDGIKLKEEGSKITLGSPAVVLGLEVKAPIPSSGKRTVWRKSSEHRGPPNKFNGDA
jgi:hypothetical protein